MQCPFCNYPDSHVVYTRLIDFKNIIERRRECMRCNQRYTTQEKYRDMYNQKGRIA